jgi:hypothetical protein
MTAKEQLLQELESASNELIEAVLSFLKFAKAATVYNRQEPTLPAQAGKSLWQIADDFIKDLPASELEKLPKDGAEQHDHYIYGTEKL